MQAQASTGPRTASGKFAVSKNALTHGLSAANIDRFPESIRDAYAAFLADHYAEWQPASLQEEIFVQRLAFAQFQLQRAQSFYAAAQEALLLDPSAENEKRLQRFARHYHGLERSAQSALKELRLFIADRVVSADAPAGVEFPLAFPHHLVTDRASTRQPLERTALRYACAASAAPPDAIME